MHYELKHIVALKHVSQQLLVFSLGFQNRIMKHGSRIEQLTTLI
jgi:hypothetical protein